MIVAESLQQILHVHDTVISIAGIESISIKNCEREVIRRCDISAAVFDVEGYQSLVPLEGVAARESSGSEDTGKGYVVVEFGRDGLYGLDGLVLEGIS